MPGLRALTILLFFVLLCLTRAQNDAPTSTPNAATTSSRPPTPTTNHAIVEPISSKSVDGSPKTSSIPASATSHSVTAALKPHSGTSSHTRVITISHSAVSSPEFSFPPHHTLPPGTAPAHGFNGSAGHAGAGQQRPVHHQSQSVVAIVFEALGGLAGLLLILGCGRCLYHYRRTPRYDGVTAAIDRHNLDRELSEMEEALPARRISYVPPPPPYQGAPKYEEAVQPPDQL